MPDYISKLVVVQFPPEEREVNEQTVRSVSVRCTATQAKIGATVWPNLADVPIEEGDLLVLEGKATRTTKTGDDGETRTYNNLSVNGIANLGKVKRVRKEKTETTESSPAPATQTDDIPF